MTLESGALTNVFLAVIALINLMILAIVYRYVYRRKESGPDK